MKFSVGGAHRLDHPEAPRSEEHTSELQSRLQLVCRLLLETKINVGIYVGAFLALTPNGLPTRRLLPCAINGSILWSALQVLCTCVVQPFRHRASACCIYGT